MSYDDEQGYGSRDSGSRGDDAYSTLGGTRQTRTRLPEGNPGTLHGRRPARNTRSLVMAVGVVVLLVAAIAFANLGGGDKSDNVDPAVPGSSRADTAEGTAPTAPTGTDPVTGKNGSIASGFAHDEQGAQSAAANYTVVLGSDQMFNSDGRHKITEAVYAPDVAASRQARIDEAYSGTAFLSSIGLNPDGTPPDALTFISRSNPVGAKIERYSGDQATVAVWYSALFGLAGEGSKNPVSEGWYTTTYELEWVNGDWKVTDFAQKDGPVPVGRDQAASPADQMADAVTEFGGFTYAR
ncbi:hypothetical protein OHT52_15900 [Streptomyces sp. NBC_00247]|uniref:hypothetical protein n=1 Tax=Streptomyces sp. NBC_00247 TaxID=2975689 RepID=UPI002E2CB227|nr:hypothetical protein [Streptomyces sp. NBC_00247]